jgi:hypothetical protein
VSNCRPSLRHLCEWTTLAENQWPHIGRKLTPITD